MATTIRPHGHTTIPDTRIDATAGYLIDRNLRPHEVIDALVRQLGVSVGEAFAATDKALRAKGDTYSAPRV